MPDLASVFSELKALMSPYAARLDVKTDSDTELYLDTRHRQKNGRALFFGAVQVKKGFVSFHLMPVYVQPALLEGVGQGTDDVLLADQFGKGFRPPLAGQDLVTHGRILSEAPAALGPNRGRSGEPDAG